MGRRPGREAALPRLAAAVGPRVQGHDARREAQQAQRVEVQRDGGAKQRQRRGQSEGAV